MLIDTNNNTYGKGPALKAAGVTDVIRYIAAGLVSNEKVIKPAEARYLAEQGIGLGLVYEIGGRPSGAGVGQRDGNFAAAYAKTVGAPRDAVIWYTVDFDASSIDYPGIAAAFKAFKRACAPDYRTGCYASGYISDRLAADGLIDNVSTDAPMDSTGGDSLIWLTDSLGFRGTRASVAGQRYIMLQGLPTTVAGLDADINKLHPGILRPDLSHAGTFIPFADPQDPRVVSDPASVEGSVEWTQTMLNKHAPGYAGALLDVDGVLGPMTLKAIESFQRDHGLAVDGIVGPLTVDAIKGLA